MSKYASLFSSAPPSQEAAPSKGRPASYHLLIVDDEPNVLKALQRVFREERYKISTASGGPEALALLERQRVHLMMTDHQMPGMSGADLLRRAKSLSPDTIRIMLTGQADIAAVMGAVNEGAVYKFVLKPWNDDDLRVTVALALEQYELIKENRALKQANEKKAKELQALATRAVTNHSQLPRLLRKHQLLDARRLQELEEARRSRKMPVIKVLHEKQWIGESVLCGLIKKEFQVEEVAPAESRVPQAVASLIPRSFCEGQWVVPLKLNGNQLMLAMADPTDIGLLDDIRFLSGLEIVPVLATGPAVEAKIKDVYGDENAVVEADALVASYDPYETIEVVIEQDDDVAVEELLRQTDGLPAIRIVNAIISEAVRLNASDIHIQPRTKSVVVRYRMDGILQDKIHLPHHLLMSVVSRIKVMAELDIAERRKPQDGRITVKTPARIVDLRISTLPTINGEKVVMRILDRNAQVRSLSELGFSPEVLRQVEDISGKPQGLILTTGPTGSGKTTTLYSLLHHNSDAGKNYITIEDPVEYYLDVAGQVAIRQRIGLDFVTVLRAILRQDPDVVLLGEIRDLETAEVAFHAALTGHLIFSSLHTNSAVATIARLQDLGVKPYIIASALEGIIAQRLVRRICEACRTSVETPPQLLNMLGPVFLNAPIRAYHGKGCDRCHNTGYRGRLGIYEVLVPDDHLRQLIAAGGSARDILQATRQLGLTPMIESARAKVEQGETTVQEVLRVLGPQGIAFRSCRHCAQKLEANFEFCPSCGDRVKLTCEGCRAALERSWKTCPFCGAPRGSAPA
jgi:type II secretory ATPase GspE/PulE/Tfp pilus assembly ATPase PilB-like protein/FixJ family two-component response regulator